jgi:ATP-binding cassette, subfamily B, bacterial PglK
MKNFINKIMYILGEKRKSFFLMVFLFLISSFFELMGIGIIYPYINVIANFDSIHDNSFINIIIDIFGVSTKEEIIVILSILLVGVFIIRNISYFTVQYMIQFNTNTVLEHVRNKMFKSYLKASY